ncbi:Zn-ribbon domain-containing OB-fold protein [Candidatus Micrarchaeota archaeon]|nr:Zn-ribbon domain-containing OB-fold protein [Candidatus Micrarchaeota archaeon]
MGVGLSLSWRRIPERYTLLGTKCDNCKINYFPTRKICPKCRRKGSVKDVRFSGKGKIYSYTLVTSPPTGFELEAPYILAIVELVEGPKLTTQIVDTKLEEVKIGMPVEMAFRKIQEEGEEGLIHYGFKFKKVRRMTSGI